MSQGPNPNQPRELTEEEARDLNRRVQGFNAEMIPLLKKWEVGLGASAFLLPDGRVGARPQLFNDQPAPAPVTNPDAPKEDKGKLAEA